MIVMQRYTVRYLTSSGTIGQFTIEALGPRKAAGTARLRLNGMGMAKAKIIGIALS